jgi:hypothetical protein
LVISIYTAISQVFTTLNDWPEVVVEFRKLYNSRGIRPPTTLTVPEMPDMHQKIFYAGVQSLTRASSHQAGKFYNKVMYNIEVLVFSLWWFGAVSTLSPGSVSHFHSLTFQGFVDFPQDHTSLVQVLLQCVQTQICLFLKN